MGGRGGTEEYVEDEGEAPRMLVHLYLSVQVGGRKAAVGRGCLQGEAAWPT